MKIVLNDCYGGFGLSYLAQALYLLVQGKTPYFYVQNHSSSYGVRTYTLAHDPQKINDLWAYCSFTFQGEFIDHFPKDIVNFKDIDRTDPILVSIVEILGSRAASSKLSFLTVVEIPDGTQYKIDSYDGVESIITRDDDDWITASPVYQDPEINRKINNLCSLFNIKTSYDSDLTFKYDQ